MSLGQKSKFCGCKKHIQARDDFKRHKNAWTTAVVERPCSFSFLFEVTTQSTSATETSSIHQGSCRASCTTLTSSVAVDTRSSEGDKSQDEQHSSFPEVSSENSCSDILPMKVDLLEYFLLYKYKMKQLILKEDMLGIVGQDNQEQFAYILKKASEHIEVVCAVDLKEVNSSNHSYDLVSKLKLPNNGRVHRGKGWPKTGLLMNILALIFLNGSCVTEEGLWNFLNRMDIYAGKKHFIYGEPRKLINKYFVRLKYLQYRQVPDSDPAYYKFLWGPKAHEETNKTKVLEFLDKVGHAVLAAFPVWCEEVLQHAKRARATDAAGAGVNTSASQGSMTQAPCT